MKRLKRLFLARAAMTLLVVVLTASTAWARQGYMDYDPVTKTFTKKWADCVVIGDGGLVHYSATLDFLENYTFTQENGKDGWYWIDNNWTITPDNMVRVEGNVKLIIRDGKTVNIKRGISLGENASLTIYSDVQGTGKLIVNDVKQDYAAIGVHKDNTLTINGCYIEVSGGLGSAGIGGNCDGSSGDIVINGGTVVAHPGSEYTDFTSSRGDRCYAGCGIGCGGIVTNYVTGYNGGSNVGGSITINGGTVRTTDMGESALRDSDLKGTVTITGGTVSHINSGTLLPIYTNSIILDYSNNDFCLKSGQFVSNSLKLNKIFKDEKSGAAYMPMETTNISEMGKLNGKTLIPCTDPLYAIYNQGYHCYYNIFVAGNETNESLAGCPVTVRVTPNEGYLMTGFSIEPSVPFTIDGNNVTFTMPENAVTVQATIVNENEHPGTGTAADPYRIRTESDWMTLSENIRNHYELYGEKCYRLMNDIEVNGGQSASARDAQINGFAGTFDGDGHTLTFNYSGGKDFLSPFRLVMNATIKNLRVAGNISINGRNTACAGGIMGQVQGNCTIENCTSAVNYTNCSGFNHGGLAGMITSGSTLTIKNSKFTGKISGNPSGFWGGFTGKNDGQVILTDVLCAPENISISGFVSFSCDGSVSYTRAYRKTDQGSKQGTRVYDEAPADRLTTKIIAFDGNTYWAEGTAAISGIDDMYLLKETPVAIDYNVSFDGSDLNRQNFTAVIKDSEGTETAYPIAMPGTYTLTVTGTGNYAGSITSKKFLVYSYDATAYIDSEGNQQTVETRQLTSGSELPVGDNDWWFVKDETTFYGRLEISGTKNLILCDGATLNIPKGIHLKEGNTLNIYGQSGGTGKLIINGVANNQAGIGGNNYESAGVLNVNGGDISVTAGEHAAGIGGGYYGNGGIFTINGGKVTARTNNGPFGGPAAIGGGGCYNGIGGDKGGNGGTVNINGGIVSATGTSNPAWRCQGIGGGHNNNEGTINIDWKNVTDKVYANSYNATVNLNDKFVWEGTTTQATSSNIGGRTIVPAMTVTDASATGGTVAFNDGVTSGTNIAIGSTVSFTVTPDEGYDVNLVKMNDTEIKPDGEGVYSFEMPAEDVTITAFWSVPVEPTLTVVGNYTYMGSQITPEVTLMVNGTEISSHEYTVTTQNSTKVGTATVTITDVPGGEYTFNSISKEFDIQRKAITVSGITAKNKVKDGTTEVVLDLSNVVLAGKVESDELTVTVDGEFEDADAGEDKTVTLSNLSLSGKNADSYELADEGQQTEAIATIYAPHTVKFVGEDGTTELTGIDQQTVLNGGKATEPELTDANRPTKEGYRFMGWNRNGEEFDFDTTLDFETTTTVALTPRFYKEYLVTGVDCQVNGNHTTTVVKGETVTLTSTTVKPNDETKIWASYTVNYYDNINTPTHINFVMTGNANNEATFVVPDMPAEAVDIVARAEYVLDGNLLTEMADADDANIYHIKNGSDLNFVERWMYTNNNEYMEGKTLVLDNDIDLEGTDFKGFRKEFRGTFNGNGKTISGFSVNNNGSAGFFMSVDGTVKDLTLKGSVKGSGEYSYLGGIAAFVQSTGSIDNCVSLVKVSENYNFTTRGGIAGKNSGTITNSLYLGTGYFAGSYKPVEVVGNDEGTVTDCAALYTIEGNDVEDWGVVTIDGISTSDGDEVEGYFKAGSDIMLTLSAPAKAGYKLKGFKYSEDDSDEDVNLSFYGGNSYMLAGISQNVCLYPNYTYKALQDLDQDEQNYYLITNKADLEAVAQAVADLNGASDMKFKLANDLENVGNFSGIATGGDYDHSFAGIFDGDGHTISGMTISANADNVGFIGYLTGTVKNLTLKNCTVTNTSNADYTYAGMLAGGGYNGTLENCFVFGGSVSGMMAGAIMGDYYLGGHDNLYNDNVTVISGGETKAPGTCGTSNGDNGYERVAILGWTVKFLDFDGVTELADAQLVANDHAAVAPTNVKEPAAREHFTLNEGEWLTANGDVYLFWDGSTGTYLNANTVLTPSWTEEETWTVSFAPGEGTGTMDDVLVYKSDAAAGWNLPWCSFDAPENKQFLNWKSSADNTEILSGMPLTFSDNITLTAQWRGNSLELADDGDNSIIIGMYDGEDNCTVTLKDRTLYKDGEWNTICLPFDVTLEGSPLEGATAKTLVNATMTGAHVELNFGEEVTELSAGVPYIIKWDNDGSDNIFEPTFTDVTVVSSTVEERTVSLAEGNVQFIGYYDAFSIDADDDDVYYLTSGNTFKHTAAGRTLNACRAYFRFSEAAQARQFVLNFGENGGTTTGIVEVDNGTNTDGSTYDLLGRKAPRGQLRKGLYIKDGKKVVVK